MAYEYSSQNQRLNFPNPLRIHNGFLAGAAAVILIAGFWLLFSARSALSNGANGAALLAAITAVLMLGMAATFLYQCLSQLRFYFGRSRPPGLAPQLNPDQEGTSDEAQRIIKETLRQQAIEYKEPSGPIAGVLYAILPNLIYAPSPLRTYAERQFKGGVEIAALLLGLLVAAVFGVSRAGAHSSVLSWVSVIFLVAAIPSLLLNNGAEPARKGGLKSLSVEWLIALACFAVIGPVALSLLGTHLPRPPLHLEVYNLAVFLVLALALHAMFFAAVVRQLTPPPPTAVSMIQDTWNLSNSPALITAEFLRATQEAWAEKIPNRRYVRLEPKIDLNAQSGAFQAEIIEETQPFPMAINSERSDQIAPSGSPPLVLGLDAFGLAMILGATVATCLAASGLMDGAGLNGVAVLYAIFFWTLGTAAFAAAQRLWLRFDFQSQLLWLELQGPYISARVEQGNVIRGSLRASSSLVQVEGMTYRLWAANVHTASFGKDAVRHFVSVYGAPDLVEALTTRLKTFAAGQASVADLGNAANAERVARNSALADNARFGAGGRLSSDEIATLTKQGGFPEP